MEDADKTDQLILGIGKVTVKSGPAIREARASYNRLSSDAKQYVKHLDVLEAAEKKYVEITNSEEADIQGAKKTDQLIENIGKVTLESGPAIREARASYDSLTEQGKEMVKHLDVLVSAEKEYAELVSAEKVRVTKELIDSIGEVTLESGPAIREARKSYEELNQDEKKQITNIEVLIEAEKKYEDLKADEETAIRNTEKLIGEIGKVTLKSRTAIEKARKSYDSLSEEGKKKVGNFKVLSDAEKKYKELKDIDDRDTEAAKKVDDAIMKIGKVTLQSGEYIGKVEDMYNELSDGAVAKLKHLDVLEKAEDEYSEICQKADLEVATVELSSQFFKIRDGYKITATGNHINARPVVTDVKGNRLQADRDYTVKYSKSKRTEPGKYVITIYGKGNYRGKNHIDLYITPKAPSKVTARLSKASGGYDDAVVSWSSSSDNAGYMVYYRSQGKSDWTYITRTTRTSIVKKDLYDGRTYEFKILPYYKHDGVRYRSLKYSTTSVRTLKKVNFYSVSKYSSTKVRLKWYNIDGETGYQLARATSSSSSKLSIYTYKTSSSGSKVLTVPRGRRYYYKVRAYKELSDGTKVYAPWSSVRSCTI